MSNSTAEDETKLKDTVIESLASSGILSDFKVKLGLEIIKALETDLEVNWAKGSGDQLPKTDKFQKLEPHLHTNEGVLAFYLIQDTLERLGLHYTCTILKTELGDNWNLFKNKSKNDIKQLLSNFNLEGGILQGNDQLNGCNSNSTTSEHNTKTQPETKPVLIDLIGKLLRGEICSNRNSFSNETFVKSPISENSNDTKTRSASHVTSATYTES